MASTALSDRPKSRQYDNSDDLTRFDAEMEEAFNGFANRLDDDRDATVRDRLSATDVAEALGIDEEITISKRRKPIPKLDSARLLSPGGIPTLRRISKSKFKFRGKGHEFSDVALLLRTYQLWLDDLYPRAKFADGLRIIEQLGHTKQMQMMRKQWIDESRREALGLTEIGSPRGEDTEPVSGVQQASSNSGQGSRASVTEQSGDTSNLEASDAVESSRLMPSTNADGLDEDELDALLAEESNQMSDTNHQRPSEPEQDELDALLDEEESHGFNQEQSIFGAAGSRPPNDYEDDEQALHEMDMM